MGAPTTARGGQVVTARPAAPLPPGSYTARWRVTGTDGDLVEEEFRFGVGYALTAAAPGAERRADRWLSAALRWLLFAGFAIAFGGLIGERFIVSARTENPRLAAPRSAIPGALVAAGVAATGLAAQALVDAGRVRCVVARRFRCRRVDRGRRTGRRVGAGAATTANVALMPLLVVVAAEGWRSPRRPRPGRGALC